MGKNFFCSRFPSERYCQSFICSEHTFDRRIKPLRILKSDLHYCHLITYTLLITSLVSVELDCKTVGFFLKISKEIGKAWREARESLSLPLSRSLFSASFQTFCLTVRACLNTQKYGQFCSLQLNWKELTRDRLKWRSLISEGAEPVDKKRTKGKQLMRKSRLVMQHLIDLC